MATEETKTPGLLATSGGEAENGTEIRNKHYNTSTNMHVFYIRHLLFVVLPRCV